MGEHARHAGRASGNALRQPPAARRPFGAAGRWTGTAPAALLYTIGVSRRVTRKGQNPFDLRRTFSHQTATFTLEKCPEGNEAVATRCNRTVRMQRSTGPIAGRPAISRPDSGHERTASPPHVRRCRGLRAARRGHRDPPLFSVVTASEPVFQTLLVAHDFSPSSKRALAHAVDVAARTGATLHLMYVDRTAEGVLFEGGKAPPDDELQDRFEERCRASLAPHDRSPAEDRVVCHAVRGVSPAPLLVEKAEEIEADLIVTGTEGRRGARRLIVGSVAEEVLRTAPCPVLTVRQRGAGGASGSTDEAPADDDSGSADEIPALR